MRKQQYEDRNSMMPQTPMMPPCMFPPGTAYNPIGVPPGAGMQPAFPPGAGIQPAFPPGGMPAVMPPSPQQPVDFEIEPGPPVMTDRGYIQGYLRTVIGRRVKIEFILGTNMFIDREGILVDVGIDHVVIRETETDDLLLADLYSIKFVRIYF